MYRLLCSSRGLKCTQCKYNAQKSERFVSLFTSRLKYRDQIMMRRFMSTHRRSDFSNNRQSLWLLGIGTGFVLALGLKYADFVSERCECDVQKTHTTQTDIKYTCAIQVSRDLIQRIKVQVSHQRCYLCCVTLSLGLIGVESNVILLNSLLNV